MKTYNLEKTFQNRLKMKKERKEKQPISFFFLETVPQFFKKLKNKISNLYWQIIYRVHPEHRYHMINTHLKPGYYDIDKLMLHSNMALLIRYVEDEHGGETEFKQFIIELNDPENNENGEFLKKQKRYENEAYTIYKWWKYEHPNMLKELEEAYLNYLNIDKNSSNPTNLELKINNQEDEMLKRLIDIRTGLWT